MKNSTIILVTFLAVGVLPAACNKKLNVFPNNANVDGDLIKDQKSAQAVLNGVYYRFANAGLDNYGTSSIQSTRWIDIYEWFPSELAGSVVSYYYPTYTDSVYNLSFSPALGIIDSIWVYGYNLVNAANGFIRNAAPVNNLPVGVKQRMVAEARFLRAFGNAGLLFYFGQYKDPSSQYGIILRDTFVTADNVNLPRSGVAAAYSSVLADLDVAIKGLPVLNSVIYYANASDAKLLKARVLMNRGAAGDFAQVIALTNDIITNGPFVLEDSVKEIFQTKGFDSREVMLGIQPYPTERYKWFQAGWQTTVPYWSLLTDDARGQWMFLPGQSLYGDIILLLNKYPTGDIFNPPTGPLATNCYAFRLSEAYLLEAEAITLSGGDLARARSLLTTVMLHGGASPQELAAVAGAATPADLQLEIVKENLRSFICESGLDWLALRRLPFATVRRLNPNITDPTRLILPIPAAELKYNNVIQNPGY